MEEIVKAGPFHSPLFTWFQKVFFQTLPKLTIKSNFLEIWNLVFAKYYAQNNYSSYKQLFVDAIEEYYGFLVTRLICS